MRSATSIAIAFSLYAAPAAAQTPSLYACETQNADFRYLVDLRSKTLTFNDFDVMSYTRFTTRSKEEVEEYNVIFDGTVDVSKYAPPIAAHYYISLFKDDSGAVYLQDNFSNALLNLRSSEYGLTDLEQIVRGIPCQPARR